MVSSRSVALRGAVVFYCAMLFQCHYVDGFNNICDYSYDWLGIMPYKGASCLSATHD